LPFVECSLGKSQRVKQSNPLTIDAKVSFAGLVSDGSTDIFLNQWSATGGTSGLTIAGVTSGGRLRIHGTYLVVLP